MLDYSVGSYELPILSPHTVLQGSTTFMGFENVKDDLRLLKKYFKQKKISASLLAVGKEGKTVQ